MKYEIKIHCYDINETRIVESENEYDAVMPLLKEYSKFYKFNLEEFLVRKYLTWNINPVREWMTEEEGLKKLDDGVQVWTFYEGNVEEWRVGFNCYHSVNPYRNATWDRKNQPSHIMLLIEGEEPPEPPVIEKSLYEKIKNLHDSNISWYKKYYILAEDYSTLFYASAHQCAENNKNIKMDEYWVHSVCDIALMIIRAKTT